MKSTFPIAILSFFILTGCSKDKFETRPRLELKSVDTRYVSFQEAINFYLEFTDKEGDMDDILFIIRERINKKEPKMVSEEQDIPTFPDKNKGDLQVTYSHSDPKMGLTTGINPIPIPGAGTGKFEPDTMRIGFVARDKAGNLSDTLKVDNIIVNRSL